MKVLVVEDDRTVGQFVKRGLEEQLMQVDLVDEGNEALSRASQGPYDLIVLDLRLPGLSGVEVLRTLRDRGVTTPVLVLTAQDVVDSKVQVLRLGADDYVTKPFAFDELVARVRAVLRRRGPDPHRRVTFADVVCDISTREVVRAGRPVALTAREFDLLTHFVRHPHQVFTRDAILSAVWGDAFEGDAKVVDVYVGYLRQKLGEPRLLQTVRGVGYALRE